MSNQSQAFSRRHLRVFLCHASDDKPAVRKLYQQLQAVGIEPWLDEEELLAGEDWEYEIRKAVKATDVVIVCLSKGSINKTGFVQKEIKFALDVADEQPEGTIFIIPVRLEECVVPDRLHHFHWVNLFEEKGYENLMRALQKRAAELDLTVRKKRSTSVKALPSQTSLPIEEATLENQTSLPREVDLPSNAPPVLPDRIIPPKLAKQKGFISRARSTLLVGLVLFVIAGSFGLFYYVLRPLQIQHANMDATTTATALAQDIYNQATARTPVLDDPLTGQDANNWDTLSSPQASCGFRGDGYHISIKEQNIFQPCFEQATNFSNFAVQVEMNILSGDGGALLFRAGGADPDGYRFALNLDFSDLVYGNSHLYTSYDVKTNLHQIYLLTVIAHGSTIYLYRDKRWLATVVDSSASSGKIGFDALMFTSNAEVVYKNVKVWTLS